ncbi:MAG: SCO family protein [Alphaproteobacteria bacterium]
MSLRTRRVFLSGIGALLLAGLGAVVMVTTHLRPEPGGRSALAIGGPFTLTASDGKTVTDRTFRGKWLLVYFGYTYCPDVCPTMLNDMAEALTTLGPLADKITPIFVTIDPARDTPEVLGKYVKSFDPRLVGLTGTPEEIAAVAKEYRVYFRKAPTGKGADDYLMDHSSILYIMGPDGGYVSLMAGEQKPAEIAARLRQLLTQSS